ncbi:acyl-CoA dehydrogenase [Frankia sp. R43]|uniref:acyl-CoA dehydrogenase family protein n=1 Tax=Frankia sp. R43 TaxID=269536 RepID=UPI0006CA23FF|nr:acyl-CoA dehydrogenase family protein [Frankia sp. R43]KPM54366.1 acyl-CoA dehydrogenase [Frankia sp. R43]
MSATPPRTVDPLDPLALTTQLDDTERALAQTVRQFVTERFLPQVADWYEHGIFDPALAKELGALGLLGLHLEGYGCGGGSAVAYGVACAELEAGDSGLRSFASVQGSLAMFAIHRWGSEEQKNDYLPRMAAGELIGCFGLTEADSGSDPGAMRTTARRDGDDWILDGSKMWITNGSIADVAVVWARTDEGVRGFLVDRGTPGFTTNTLHRKMSLRASVTAELVLDGVRLPERARLPLARSLAGPLSCLNEARFGILWGATGAARACYEAALSYTSTRTQFGRPLAGFQLTQQKLATMALEIGKGQLLALHLGRLKDVQGLAPAQVSMGKLANTVMASDVARTARGMLGANGISLEYPVIRHMMNLESVLTYEGTAEIHALSIGQALTGHRAFT